MTDKPDPAPERRPKRVSLFGGSSRETTASSAPASGSPQNKPRRPRRSGLSAISGTLSALVIIAGIGMVGFAAALVETRKTGPLAADKIVNITREDPISDQLENAGVIESGLLFTALTMVDGARSLLKRGDYDFKAGASLRDVEQTLMSGKFVLHSITLPEGFTSEQIVARLRENDVLAGDIRELPREGSLLPETYKFARGETRSALLVKMSRDQQKLVEDIWKRRAPDLPIKSPGELVTLASIVEKETGKVDERPRVAGVFVNRLAKHMRLQSDPTIVYGLVFGKGTLGHAITKAELDQATPYNTYTIDGLPPGPICNPGKAALEAVANPVHSKELFFVADGTGGHAFAETLDQHLKNVARWRQIEKDAKDKLSPEAAPPATRGDLSPQESRSYGELLPAHLPPTADALHPQAYGALASVAQPRVKRSLANTYARYGESLRTREAMLEKGGLPAAAAKAAAASSLDQLGAIVTGVNDTPDVTSMSGDEPAGSATGGVSSVPMSPAALADQRAREARFGDGAPLAMAAQQPTPTPSASPALAAIRSKVFDASEGTNLDPLRNKTYDLSYGKSIPELR